MKQEIAGRISTQHELAESEQQSQITFAEAPVGIGHTSLRGRFLRVNDLLCQFTGYTRDELLSKTWQEITHPNDLTADETQSAILLSSNRESSYTLDKRYICRDGSTVWVNLTAAVVRTEKGTPNFFISIVTDLTSRHEAEQRLTQERNLLRTLIDGLPDSIYIKDREGRYLAHNLAGQKMLSPHGEERAMGKTVHDFPILEHHADLYAKDDRHVIETGQAVVDREEPFQQENGTEGWFLTTKFPLRNSAGEIIGLIGITRDITGQKSEELNKEKISQKLQTTQKLEAMGLLAGGIAHDFNNILTGVHGHAGLARLSAKGNAELLSYVREIEHSAERASELCQQMLDYSGHNRHEQQRLDLSATIKQTLPLLPHSIGKNARLRFEPAENIPATVGDPTQLRQVVMNLVVNSGDALATEEGSIHIHTGAMRADRAYLDSGYLEEKLPEGDYLFLEVSDNGEGMSPDVQSNIFDPFFTTKREGRGLGLATVIGIVRSHRGAIRVHSQPGQGTLFRILLPASEQPAEQFPEDIQTGWDWLGSGTVLVVDDEETVRTVAARILEALGFTTEICTNGKSAVETMRLAPDRYRLILMDFSMPALDGAKASAAIRKINSSIPIILMSGYWEEKATSSFAEHTVSAFIKKPFTPEKLRDEIRAVIEKV
jgi:two-component system, cell cycle sensor histidine kinase and response regulator CckA